LKNWLALILLLLPASLPGFGAPTEVTAEYKVFRNGILIGRVLESYVRKGDAYTIQSTTRSDGALKIFLDDTLTLTSEGRFGPRGLQPQFFELKRAGNNTRDVRATFDWNRGVMHSEFRGETKEVAVPSGTQDRLSIMYQFMNLTLRGDTIDLHMSNGRKVERYTYRKTEEVELKTAAGDFEALHFERVGREEGQSKAQVWLAKDRFNLPLRVVYDDANGGRLDQTIVDLQTR